MELEETKGSEIGSDVEFKLELDPKQREAVELCCDLSVKHRLVGVTGSAGTGKTTIMKKVHDAVKANGYRITLCAPTGKASKRIKEATGIDAQTIHRLLEYPHPGDRDPQTGKPLRTTDPQRHRYRPLDFDCVLVDEAAMVNQEVYRNLVDALPPGGTIRFFGDINQLPPIEKDKKNEALPSPFKVVLNKFSSVTLDHIHRQGEGSGIVTNGDLIIKGKMPRQTHDFHYVLDNTPLEHIRTHAARTGPVDFMSTSNQIITPTNQGWIGTYKLNSMLQNMYQHDANARDFLMLPRHQWADKMPVHITVGDKVIWSENNYDLQIFNGETGIVMEISELGEVVIDFGDRSVIVPPIIETTNQYGNLVTYDPRRSIDLAYAITTHKSQGSEYGHVLYVMHSSRPYTLNRHNFYTGVTRARNAVRVVADQRALYMSVTKKG